MDVISILKNFGGVLATVTTLVYVSGYLALRARSLTLGTDPCFTLAYEGYVFAGIRFVLISLIMLLLLSPVIAFVVHGPLWMKDRIPESVVVWSQWSLLVMLAFYTLFMTASIMSVSGVLLNAKKEGFSAQLEGAVMGEQTGFFLMLGVFMMTTLSVLWLKSRLPAENDPLTWVLAIVVAIQIFLLPIFYGSLYADRKVRVLAATPDSVKGMEKPLGIIDRTSNNVTLLGLDNNGNRRLVTIKLEDLNGIPVEKIVYLNQFVKNDISHAREKGAATMAGTTKTNNKSGVKQGFFSQLIGYLHLAIENIGSLGDDVIESGQIWSVEFDNLGSPGKPKKIGAASNLAYPVFDPKTQTIYAVQQGRIVRLDHGGEQLKEINQGKRWVKLFCVTEEGEIFGMVYENDEGRMAVLHADGEVTLAPEPQSAEEQKARSVLEQESHVYSGNRSLYVGRSARGGRGFDVFYKEEKVFNLSDCGDDQCGQPSISTDFRRVLYVRKSRY